MTFWCRSRKSAKAAAAKGEGLLRPLSQFCSASSVTGKDPSLKTVSAWAWLRLFLALHSLSRWITGERGLGIGMPFSQITAGRCESAENRFFETFHERKSFRARASFPEGEEARPEDAPGLVKRLRQPAGAGDALFRFSSQVLFL